MILSETTEQVQLTLVTKIFSPVPKFLRWESVALHPLRNIPLEEACCGVCSMCSWGKCRMERGWVRQSGKVRQKVLVVCSSIFSYTREQRTLSTCGPGNHSVEWVWELCPLAGLYLSPFLFCFTGAWSSERPATENCAFSNSHIYPLWGVGGGRPLFVECLLINAFHVKDLLRMCSPQWEHRKSGWPLTRGSSLTVWHSVQRLAL